MRLGPHGFVTLSRELLEKGHLVHCRTLGSSMFPLILSGSKIQVEPVKMGEVQPGDVIVYKTSGDTIVAHRLLGKRLVHGRVLLTTRGDFFPPGAVEKIGAEQVLGRVAAVYWGSRLRIRLNAGPGRALGRFLARISPLSRRVHPAFFKVKERLARFLSRQV